MTGTDYNGIKSKVIKILPAKQWKQLKQYDDSGWMYDEEEMQSEDYDIDMNNDYLVAVRDENGENIVYKYGPDGFEVD